MAKLPRIKAAEVIAALERLGFVQIRQKGSHIILKKQIEIEIDGIAVTREVGCVVPLHRKDIAVGTLANILRQADVSVEELLNNL
jgi:predicted RNA binding protein YcfA (HicA-like mRNA interferase family)